MSSNIFQSLPSLSPIPDDIDEQIKRLLHAPADPALEAWLIELIKSSGHMSTGDDMRWRMLCIVWLAMAYNTDEAWPYLMWLNTGEATMSTHFSEIFTEAVDHFETHAIVASWQAQATDERLVTFFKDFYPIPARHRMRTLMRRLLPQASRPETGLWLTAFCEGTAYNDANYLRSWRLLASAWYAAAFNAAEGIGYLNSLTNNAPTLSPVDNKMMMDAAEEANGLATMIGLIADCPNPDVKTILKDFGHPHLPTVTETILHSSPDYEHLGQGNSQIPAAVESFERNLSSLQQAQIQPKKAAILDLACGPLATQTLLLNSAGYKTLGLDLEIPPGYLALSGVKDWLKRKQHTKAWKTATDDYYQNLAQQANVTLKWGKVKISLADLTQLDLADQSFDAVICNDYLHLAPDVHGLLSEAARVLKAGGLFLANIRPYAALAGAFQLDPDLPWHHLRRDGPLITNISLNKWREAQFQQALEQYFSLEQWLPESEPQAQTLLTPEIQAELAEYEPDELTRKEIMVVARK